MNKFHTKLYMVDIGFTKDTVIYELVPKEVTRLKTATTDDIKNTLENIGVKKLIVDAAMPEQAERLGRDFEVTKLRFSVLEAHNKE